MLKRRNHAWTLADEERLRVLAGQGVYLRNIAVRLRRSESSIKKRARDIGVAVLRTPRRPFRTSR